MLQSLHVKNLALIEEAEVEWKDGLNILTGETGAGKSLLLGSVHLALGGKYSAAMLREGADYGLVEMAFYIRDRKQKEKLLELDIEPEDGMVVLSRKLMDGRSISRINGEMVPIGRLCEVTRKAAGGDFTVRAKEDNSAELSVLNSSFNSMIDLFLISELKIKAMQLSESLQPERSREMRSL